MNGSEKVHSKIDIDWSEVELENSKISAGICFFLLIIAVRFKKKKSNLMLCYNLIKCGLKN